MSPRLLNAADWPSSRHVVASRDGTKIAVTDTGQGRPILLVHGITLTHEVWLPQIRALRERFRVLAMDVRGHGDSVPVVEGYSPALFGHDIAAVLETLDLHDAVLVGHSLGGTNIAQFAADHPDFVRARVGGLVLVGTFAFCAGRRRVVARAVRPHADHGDGRDDAATQACGHAPARACWWWP